MKRPTRVPASTVVRMNTASNMMAKWYHTLMRPRPKLVPKMLAMPTASDGAPPVRAKRVLSPISFARSCIWSTVTGKPQLEIVCTASTAAAPTMPVPVLMAKYTPGSEQRRGDHRHDADEGFERHAAVAGKARILFVGDELGRRAARHQRMEARDGAARDGDEDEREQLAGEEGPVPSTNCVIAGIFSVGCMRMMAMASRPTTPSFRNVDR